MQLQSISGLNLAQIQVIEALSLKCAAIDGNAVPIYRHLLEHDRPFPCGVLAYDNENLIGFLRTFFFAEHEFEISMMVAPTHRRRGIATSMLDHLLPVIRSQYIHKFNITAPYGLNEEWINQLGFDFTGVQYQMQYQPQATVPAIQLSVNNLIRQATIDDLPYLTAIHRAGFPTENAEIADYLQMLVTDSNHKIFIIESSGLPVGKAHMRFQGDAAYLADVAVFPKHQSKGYARALISHCLHLLRDTHASSIFLDLEDHNTRARKIYLDLGFTIVNTHQCWSREINFEEFNLTDFLKHL